MNRTKLTAALLTAAAAIIPLSVNSLNAHPDEPVFAADTADPAAAVKLPDWIPDDFESALNFRNTYGATRIDSGLICIVFQESQERATENDPNTPARYRLVTTEDVMMQKLKQTVYSQKGSEYVYEVVVFRPQQQCKFEAALVDTWLKGAAAESLDLGYSHAIAYYTFSVDADNQITETDLCGWVPDCHTEYAAFLKEHGELSRRENQVVFCLSAGAGTPYGWEIRSHAYDEYFKLLTVSDCSLLTAEPLDGGTVSRIMVFEAIKDGHAQIDMDYGALYSTGKIERTLTADCQILDGAKTVLLSGDTRIRFEDADTGALLDFPNAAAPMHLTPTIGYLTDIEGQLIYADTAIMADSNPYIWHLPDKTPDVYDISLNAAALPEGYSLPQDYKKIKVYENDAYDFVFRLQSGSSPATLAGDLNGDGEFKISDIVLLQKWMLCDADAKPADWKAADFNKDGQLDAADLTLMKRTLLSQKQTNPPAAVKLLKRGGYAGVHIEWNVYQEDGKYYISWLDAKQSKDLEPVITEITEADYQAVMSFDYAKIIADYDPNFFPHILDGYYYQTVITYTDGTEITTKADMSTLEDLLYSITNKLTQ